MDEKMDLVQIDQAAAALSNGQTSPVDYANALLMIENETGVTKKDIIIERLKIYKGIIVTEENLEDSKKLKTSINKVATNASNLRRDVKKEFLKQQEAYWNGITEIKDEAERIVAELNEGIETFETKRKEEQKQLLIEKIINPKLNELIGEGKLDQKHADMFEFNDSWTNTTAVSKATGMPVKKTQDEMNAELQRITLLFNQYMSDVQQIRNGLEMVLLKAQETTESLGITEDTYISLLEAGVGVPEIQQRIVNDVSRIKEAAEAKAKKAQEKAAEEAKQAIHEEIHAEEETATEGEKLAKNQIQVVDKNGEVIAVARPGIIKFKTEEIKNLGKTYEYTYTFKGSYREIKEFSTILKALKELNPGFEYEKK